MNLLPRNRPRLSTMKINWMKLRTAPKSSWKSRKLIWKISTNFQRIHSISSWINWGIETSMSTYRLLSGSDLFQVIGLIEFQTKFARCTRKFMKFTSKWMWKFWSFVSFWFDFFLRYYIDYTNLIHHGDETFRDMYRMAVFYFELVHDEIEDSMNSSNKL